MLWRDLSEDKKNLLIRDRAYYKLVSTNPGYWIEKGFLEKKLLYIDDDRSKKYTYKLTDRGFNALKRVVEKELRLKYYTHSVKEKMRQVKVPTLFNTCDWGMTQ